MKIIKNIYLIVLLIMAATVTIACGNVGKEKAMGRYVEEEVELPNEINERDEFILSMITNPKDELEIYTCKTWDGLHRYILGADGTWTENTPAWELGDLIHCLSTFQYGEDGKLYVAQGVNENSALMFKLYELSEDGTKLQLPMEGWDIVDETGAYPIITDFNVMENGEVLAKEYDSERGFHYDASGKKLSEFESGAESSVNSAGSDIISLNETRDKILFLDKTTGLENKKVAITQSDPEVDYSNVAICNKGNDNIYIANRSGIFYINKNSSVLQTMVDGMNTTLNISHLSIKSMAITEDDKFYVLFKDKGGFGGQLMSYVYKSDVPTVPDKELVISSLEENEIIKEAIVEFQRKYPEVYIDYRVAKVNGSGLPDEEYIKVLNSEILAGEGADIIVCDDLPETDYVDKGIFADISDVINPLVESDQIYGNIVDFYKQENKIYTLPMKFEVCVYTGNQDAVAAASSSLEELQKYYANNQEIPLLGEKLSYKQLFNWYYGVYHGELFDNQGLPVPDKMTAFLEQLKSINQYNEKYTETEDWFTKNCYLDLAQEKSQLAITNIYNIDSLLYANNSLYDPTMPRDNILLSAGAFQPDTVVGINKNSNEKKIAKDFIDILLSEKVQQSDKGSGIPMNKNAILHWYEEYDEWIINRYIQDNETGFQLVVTYPAEKSQVDSLVNMINDLSTPVRYDMTIYNFMINEIDPLFQGEKTAEEVTASILEKIAGIKTE